MKILQIKIIHIPKLIYVLGQQKSFVGIYATKFKLAQHNFS